MRSLPEGVVSDTSQKRETGTVAVTLQHDNRISSVSWSTCRCGGDALDVLCCAGRGRYGTFACVEKDEKEKKDVTNLGR